MCQKANFSKRNIYLMKYLRANESINSITKKKKENVIKHRCCLFFVCILLLFR